MTTLSSTYVIAAAGMIVLLAIATIAQAALACGCITTLIVGLVFGLVAMVAASAAVLVQINHMN